MKTLSGNSSNYESVKYVFTDSIETTDFIRLDTSNLFYNQVIESIKKPLKMILVFGEPGTGKSILLNKVYNDLKHKEDIHFIQTPINEQKSFNKKISSLLTRGVLKTEDFSKIIDICRKLKDNKEHVIILDEAQIYSEDIMESIRLISDTRAVKFIFTLHKTQEEDIVAKKQFKTRIWESIYLKNASLDDLTKYIQKKLLNKNYYEVANAISNKHIQKIHSYTKGNFRETNKFMYTLFDIYHYYDLNQPSKINYRSLSNKFIEMSAIKLGYIDA
ncbi:MAG: AAA family ATPase [Campylobacterota bacterium]